MPEWKSYKGNSSLIPPIIPGQFSIAPVNWDVIVEQKSSYNEGDHISDFTNPIWSMEQGNDVPITPNHNPCGYWTKRFISSPILPTYEVVQQGSVNEDDGRWIAAFWLDYQNSTFGRSGLLVNSFFRFPNINVPKNATVQSAIITFTGISNPTQEGEPCNVDCYFNASDDAVVPIDETEAEALSLTLGTQWFDIPIFSTDVNYDTSDLKLSLQEIFNRSGWVSGNAVMAVLRGNDTTKPDGAPWAHRIVYDHYLDPSKVAILSIIYS